VDGFAEFCVEDWNDETIIGDVNRNSIKEIWSSPEYKKVRELHLSRNFNDVAYCGRCKDWKARTWDYDYFYAIKQVLNGKNK
jgi:MoaA/NifB/PqqE/SkfB family radical SAM enzyme